MQVDINIRGNGACPICSFNAGCRVQDSLINAMEVFSEEGNPLEMVVYSCPLFQEKKEHE
ncbi:MAG: hypothetical protein LBH43_13465 [Treponema sp.]|jgi:hypothetical protein|nr:hypothetical protein [Treponema sp.]